MISTSGEGFWSLSVQEADEVEMEIDSKGGLGISHGITGISLTADIFNLMNQTKGKSIYILTFNFNNAIT